ncbi:MULTISPECIES: pseudoazurin [Xanthobacter]|uniref:pseudoazurin n=1 Tax=Xanthobacter TaxID=279 RepID=UPI0032C1384F
MAAPAQATDFQVKMLSKGEKGMMVFQPDALKIAPGDTVTFVSVDPGHNAELIRNMAPEGAEPFAGKPSETVSHTFSVPGVYGVKCRPHYAMGMVMAIAVGEPINLDAAKAMKHPGKAQKVMDTALAELH